MLLEEEGGLLRRGARHSGRGVEGRANLNDDRHAFEVARQCIEAMAIPGVHADPERKLSTVLPDPDRGSTRRQRQKPLQA
jgi:hypothetical protein